VLIQFLNPYYSRQTNHLYRCRIIFLGIFVSMDQLLAQLSTHEVFKDLSPTELATLVPIIHIENYEVGTTVFSIGQQPNFLFYISSGQLRLHLTNNEHKTLIPGQLFGEVGIMNSDFRSGTVMAVEPTELICICANRLFQPEFVAPSVSLKIVRALGKRIVQYLRSKEQISTNEIIEQGESDFVEFKSTLRWNLRANKKDKVIENAALKTVAAFMNAQGGTLMIGVADDGALLGLEADKFANHDKMLLHLTKIIQDRIGALYIKFLHFSIERISEKDVLRIDCTPSNIPAYLKDGNLEHFYIRTGPSTTDLRLSKVYAYIKDRFDKHGDL